MTDEKRAEEVVIQLQKVCESCESGKSQACCGDFSEYNPMRMVI